MSSVHSKSDHEEELTTYQFRETPIDPAEPDRPRPEPEPSRKDRWDRLMRIIDL